MPKRSNLEPVPGKPRTLELTCKVILPETGDVHRFHISVEFMGKKSSDQCACQAAKTWLMVVHDWADVLPGPGLYGEEGPTTQRRD